MIVVEELRAAPPTLFERSSPRGADRHAKNVALLYTSRADVHLAPACDMLTTQVYAGFQHNPPGVGFMGKKTWAPGKNLQKFIAANFGIQPREQLATVDLPVGFLVGEILDGMCLTMGIATMTASCWRSVRAA